MKVLFWAEHVWPEIGGIETFSRQLVPAMQNRGYDMTVITSAETSTTTDIDSALGIKIRRYPFTDAFKNNDLHLIKIITEDINTLTRIFQPDLIHLNTLLTSTFFFLRIPKSICPPTLLTLHARLAMPEYAHNIQKLALKKIDYIVGVSQTTLNRCLQVAPQFKDHSAVIYNGRQTPSTIPKELNFDPPTLLCLGRLSQEKGFDIALEAFCTVRKHIPAAKLIIAGEGEEREALEKQASELGIANAVVFLGKIQPEKVPQLINIATIVVMPSRHDQFPLVAIEAAQMARPVVASRVGGLSESIINNQTGLLVKSQDSLKLAEGIIFLIENPEVAIKYGLVAREKARKEFDVLQFIAKYENIYQKVAGYKKRADWSVDTGSIVV